MRGANDDAGFERAMWLKDMGVDKFSHGRVDVAEAGEDERECPRRKGYVGERDTADVCGGVVCQGIEQELHDTRFVLSQVRDVF